MGRSGRLALGADRRGRRRRAGRAEPPRRRDRARRWPRSCSSARRGRGRGAGALLPVVLGAGLIAVRLARRPGRRRHRSIGRPTATARGRSSSSRPGRRATGSRPRRSRRRRAPIAAFRVAATLPRYPVVIPGDRVVVDGRDPAAARLAVRRLPRADRRGRDAHGADARGRAGARRSGPSPRGAPPWRRRRARARPPGTRGRARGRDPHRPARPGRPRPRRGVHDGRGQPRRRDLGLEHRDRGGRGRGDGRPARAAAAVGRDDRSRSSPTSRSPGASASVVRAALMAGVVLLARESGRAGRAAAALGWAATLLLVVRPGAHRRRRVPAVVARDRRADRLGDAAHRLARAARPRAAAALAGGEPRRLARRPGGDAADHPRLVRAAGDPVAGRQPRWSCRSSRRRWRPASSRWPAARWSSAGAPPVVGAVLAAPGWVILRILVAIVVRPPPGCRSRASRSARRSTSSRRPSRSPALVGARRWWRRRPRPRRPAGRTPTDRRRRGRRRPRRAPTAPADRGRGRAARAGVVALVVAVAVAGGVVAARPAGDRPRLDPRCRPGRRDPRRGLARRPAAHRRRPGPGPPARRARSRGSRRGTAGSTRSS